MASSLALSGLASGVDTSAIVDQLMSIERQKTTGITNKQVRARAEQSALKDIAAKLATLRSAADALKQSGTAFAQTQPVESSDPTRVAAAKISGAGVGGHTVQVDRLASSAQLGLAIGDLSAAGSLTVGSGTKDPVSGAWSTSTTFDYDAGATASTIADKINASSTSPVYAAVVKNGAGQDRLVLSARSTGEASRFEVTSAPAFTDDPLYASPAGSLNAQYRLDGSGTVLESESNVVENAIPGLRVTFKGVTSAPASITVGQPDIDRTAVSGKVKALVDAYNAVVDATRSDLSERNVVPATTSTDVAKGTLFGDTGLNAMLSSLRTDLRATLTGLTGVDDLSDIGIGVPGSSGGATTEDAKAGKFTLDADTLTAALDSDWTGVSAFLDKFAGTVDKLVDVQTGKSGSILDARIASGDSRLGDLADQLTALNTRLDAEEARYKAQFAAMETAMANYQTQGAWLSSQISSLG